MAVYKCKMCGGTLDVTEGQSVITCEFCGTTQTVHSFDDEKKITFFKRAEALRFRNEFDKASGIYETIVSEFPNEAEAYWGLVLCKYGIEYVDDPKTGRKVPTCHRTLFESIYNDSDYLNAIKYADVLAKDVYEKEASEIHDIQKGILEVSSKEDPYDIFICYKETDENGERTKDSVKAEEIFDLLEDNDYKVFFARVTLEDVLGSDYEAHIFNALNTAKVMLVVTSCDEFVESTWVRNEWSRYIDLIANGNKNKTIIPCYFDMDPYDLPDEMKNLQSLNLAKIGSHQDLVRGINKIFGRNSRKEAQIIAHAGGTLEGEYDLLLKKGFRFLETGDFSKANDFFDQSIGMVDKCGEGYLGQLLVQWKKGSIKEAEKIDDVSFLETALFQNAKRYASKDFEKVISEIEYNIMNNNHKKHYETYKQTIEESTSTKDVYKSINLLSNFINKSIENNKINGTKIDLFDGEVELTYSGCVRLGQLLLDETSESEDLYKIEYALRMLDSSDISTYPGAKELIKKLNEKKDELIKTYDDWAVGKLEMKELSESSSFDQQYKNIKNAIWKYSQNKYIFESFNPKDEYLTEEYNKIQDKIYDWIKSNVSVFVNMIPEDLRVMREIYKLLNSLDNTKPIEEPISALRSKIEMIEKRNKPKARIRALIAAGVLVAVLGILVGVSFILIK